MHLIKVNAINSTNSFGREMFRENPQLPATCIVAKNQLSGRGQRGTVWNSEPGENLTFSIVYPKPGISPDHQFLLSAAVATTIVEALDQFELPRLKVKWPNDIMSANYKIGGVLIENVLNDGKVAASIIGVGLNVNQKAFSGLPQAGSMFSVTQKRFDLDEVLAVLLYALEKELDQLSNKRAAEILTDYKSQLFRIHVPSTFELPDKTLFTGMIADVSLSGKLLVRTEEELLKEFDLKEVRLCF
ncbi:BirA family transcriptional regulator, biotin operon repressor / biotin-[acetyl-CoA-carboxylase] ligase [Salinimicrobium catena]|uniref:BirA family transcriptional regulator, biotin operon repressor / biotin-[acetyl-CoA-carboxylase] ligase n=1 Tax=Salinimicrobium catena TaxID=390640 RepID=A0A1H5NQ17_9FLAO|nr:biotin--[acetyl-CoA-carboxylase] ligase [Salinimicrobium catena]SDL56676.1 BirA family transcriptional regulator, biotin operon repressor / biotin-[acetyl-CoA-carboxylase] ligase [Salinimicrobium catena]SEF02907.1 BirA family transcriptional regulator, biotin operon repressor / biotin-[acetyl-CoA-carboxylase] ligase [Salinimicrobium catena]